MTTRTASDLITCLSCGRRVPKKPPGHSRCPKCRATIEAALRALENAEIDYLPPPEQGQPGSFVAHARQQRARRLLEITNPTDTDVEAIQAWAAARKRP